MKVWVHKLRIIHLCKEARWAVVVKAWSIVWILDKVLKLKEAHQTQVKLATLNIQMFSSIKTLQTHQARHRTRPKAERWLTVRQRINRHITLNFKSWGLHLIQANRSSSRILLLQDPNELKRWIYWMPQPFYNKYEGIEEAWLITKTLPNINYDLYE